MSQKGKSPGDPLAALTDELVSDVMDASDGDILADTRARGLDPTKEAYRVRDLFKGAAMKAGKKQLHAARHAVAAARANERRKIIPIDRAKALLKVVAANDPELKLTLAARNGDELTDADIQDLVQDLIELGAISESDES